MKKHFISMLAAMTAAILCLASCKLEAPAIFITVATTYDADDITEESAVLRGAVRLPDTLPDDTQYGFLLSLSESVLKSDSQEIIVFSQTPVEDATKSDPSENEESGSEAPAPREFSAKVVGFDAGTTYYFRSFALCGGFYSYGAVVAFTTAGTPETEEQTDEGTEPSEGSVPSDDTQTVE